MKAKWWMVMMVLAASLVRADDGSAVLKENKEKQASFWLTDHAKALEKAKAEKKLVLMDFTGSDWCPPCMMLERQVFSQKEFLDYAEKNLVLLKLDFPRSKPQSAEEKAQNARLEQQYRVEGYPTIIVLNSEGKQVGQLGYMEGGPAAFIAELEKLKK